MASQLYSTELQLNKANFYDTIAFLLGLSMTYGIVSSTLYDKRDDFNFEIFNFTFLDGDFPGSHFHPISAYLFCESMVL